jgi:predicted DNA-binding transcriptional regulator YafY
MIEAGVFSDRTSSLIRTWCSRRQIAFVFRADRVVDLVTAAAPGHEVGVMELTIWSWTGEPARAKRMRWR